MRKLLPLFLWASLIATVCNAQHPCGYDLLFSQVYQQNPDLWERQQQFIQNSIDEESTASYRDNEIFTIPVVVHIVWKEDEENLSEERIQEQIAALNRDFRRQNQDTTQLRPEFENISKDTRIAFELVKIVRVKTDSIFKVGVDWEDFSVQYPEGIKREESGGSDAWDPLYYLNIWVAAIQEDLVFGFAYPPPGLINWPEDAAAEAASYDGIVINYKAFGVDPPPYVTQSGETIYLRGRTLVHEVGHYLGLPHPWGHFDIDQDGCAFDDGIEDTPISAIPSFFDCDYSRNSCFANLEDLPDMVENFMDYSSDECRISFTGQQVAVMRAVLAKERKDLRLVEMDDRFADELLLYPNPSTGMARVYLRKEIKTDYEFRFRTFDRRILPVPFVANEAEPGLSFSIDISHLPDGIYLVELESAHWRFVKKLVLIR